MNKSTILVFILSVMTFASIGAVTIIMIPDSNPESLTIKKYDAIAREDYTFVDTKNISLDSIEQRYDVDREYLNKLIIDKKYKPGTTNPFATVGQTTESAGGNTSNGAGTTTPDK